MGSKLSHVEREIYSQVKHSLRLGGKTSVKRDLRRFVKWVCSNFPSVTVTSSCSLEFWDLVRENLSDVACGVDSSDRSFLALFLLISDALENSGVKRESSEVKLGNPVESVPSAPIPCPPYSPDLPRGRRREGNRGENALEDKRSPNPFLSPLLPTCRGPDHLTADLPVPLLPMPLYPVAPVVPPPSLCKSHCVRDQDSGRPQYGGPFNCSCGFCNGHAGSIVERPAVMDMDLSENQNGCFSASDGGAQNGSKSSRDLVRDSVCGTWHLGEKVSSKWHAPVRDGSLLCPLQEAVASPSGSSVVQGRAIERGPPLNTVDPPLGPPFVTTPLQKATTLSIGGGPSSGPYQHLGSHALPSSSHGRDSRRGEAEALGPGRKGELFAASVV